MEESVVWVLEMICVENHGVEAIKILFVSSYLAPGIIASDVLLSVVMESRSLTCAMELLKKHSLIERTGSETDFIIKKYTQSTIRNILKNLGLEKRFLSHILCKLWEQLVQVKYVDHLMSFLTHAKEYQSFHKLIISVRDLVLNNLLEQTRIQEAYSFSKVALNFLRNNLGVTHPITLDFQYNITILLGEMGKFAEAEKLLTSVLKENIESSNQREEFITKHALARHLLEQSKYKEALAIFQTILGDEDISETSDEVVLAAWHNYGHLLMNMGQLSEAYNILRDVLKRTREICDPEDDDISNTRMIMAAVLRKQGRYTKALELYDEIVYDRTQSLGECHFKTLMAKESYALVLIKQQRYDEALFIYYDVFEKLKRALGESHSEVLTIRANIAGALNNKGEREEAYEIYTDVYQKFKVTLGEKCKESLRVKHNIGLIHFYNGKLKEALEVLQEVHEGYNHIFGSNHEDTKEVETTVWSLKNQMHWMNLENRSSITNNLKKIETTTKNNTVESIQGYEKRWPLHHAAKNDFVIAVKLLLMAGASYCEKDCNGKTPLQLTSNERIKYWLNLTKHLFRCVRNGNNFNIWEYIAVVNAKDRNGYSPLHWIAYHGNQSALRQILEVGVDITQVSNKGNTALHIAVSRGHRDIVEIMLQRAKGSEVKKLLNTRTTISGSGVLNVAAKMGHLKIAKCLLKYGTVYDIINNNFETPWHLASDPLIYEILNDIHDLFSYIKDGNEGAVIILGKKGYDEIEAITGARNSQDHTLLQVAVMNNRRGIAGKLIKIMKESDGNGRR
ncbi:hypothetical protein TNIN_63171 [Trichonephila inaurata madagascariensis]|uniref:Uncharacterized protein n=1 Tax=Trichonephila inaurata madagascariensis TaxID=2747483 RepID=A0A8X6X9N7_9ARAC|nr:hypothetical protein TNIN_63171 [Trichonephila inaurata madagascariensis]